MEIQATRIIDGKRSRLPRPTERLLRVLNKIGFVRKVSECMPVQHRSPNSIPPVQTFIAFLISVAAGARRFAHAGWLRGDKALHALLGIDRFPTDDTIR